MKDHVEIGHLTKFDAFRAEQRPSYEPWNMVQNPYKIQNPSLILRQQSPKTR